MSKKQLYILTEALSVIGIGLAIYLLWQQLYQPSFQPCNINATVNCDAIITGPVAKTFGIPTPLIGLLGYIIILFSALYRKSKLLLGMASFGLVFCLWIGYRELIELRVICPVCVACQIVMISVFTLSVIGLRKNNNDGKNK